MNLDASVATEGGISRTFDACPVPMWACDARTLQFVSVNRSALSEYGWSRDEFLGMRLPDLHEADDVAALLDSVLDALGADGPRTSRWTHRLRDGRQVDVDVTTHAHRLGHQQLLVSVVRDVTEQRSLEDQLRHQALHDPLTGLANRAVLGDRLERLLARVGRRGGRCAVVLINLDGFRALNEARGHGAGDDVLIGVARRLEDGLRPGDMIARLGGDEFAVLLEDIVTPGDAESIADRMLEAIRRPMPIAGEDLKLTASAGVVATTADDAPLTAMEMLRNAGVALHRARLDGVARLTYVTGMHAVVADRHSLANDLRGAWLRGEMHVVYQPLVALEPPAVTGVEALARWTHPTRGPIPADVFIPLAEEQGLIGDIDRWVLEQACRAGQRWRASARPLRVSVNISGRDLDRPGLVTAVTDTLAATGLPADLLALEITEGVAVRQQEAALATLRALRDHGVSVAIDDFGTGYSMLSRLRDFPLDRIKIDRTFVRDMTDDRRDAPLVAAMIGMGKALALEVVAEGVETPEQLAFLAAHGCDQVQGFLLGRPVDGGCVVEAADSASATLASLAAAPRAR